MERNIEREPFTAQLLLQETEEGGSSIDNGGSAVTPLLLFSVFIAVCGCFACGTAVGYSSPVESAVMEELGLSTAEYSVFGSMITVGGLFGSIASGGITDMIGRRGAKLGRGMEFKNVLHRLRGDNIDISPEVTDIEELNEQVQQIAQVNLLGLFQKKYARSLVVVLGLLVLAGLGGPTGGVTFYASSILEAAGFSSSIGSVGLAVIQISTVTMVFCCFLVGFMFVLLEHDCLENLSPYFIVLGLWIFPMNVKGSAGSLAVAVASITIGILSYTFNFVTEWSYSGAFFVLGWINALAILFIVKLVPETKEMSLEEIQESLTQR